MKTRWTATGAVLSAVAAIALAAPAEEVVIVRSSDLAPYRAVEKSFTSAVGRPARSVSAAQGAAAVAAELEKPRALVLAIGPEAARLVASAAPNTPAIYALIPNPAQLPAGAAAHAVPMYADPEAQLAVVKRALPRAKKLGVVFDPAQSRTVVESYTAAAKAAGVTLVLAPVSARGEVASAVRGLVGRADALWLLPDPTVVGADTVKFMVETSLANRVPLIGFSQGLAKAGALLAFDVPYPETGAVAARFARRLLNGEGQRPEPPKGTLYLNARAAGLLGIPLSDDVRASAAEVF